MRSPTAEAAIVAATTLAATYLGLWCGHAVLAPGPVSPHPVHAALGLVLTRLAYQTIAPMLANPAGSIGAGRRLFLFLAVLTAVLSAPNSPEAARAFSAAALGSVSCLYLLERGRRRLSSPRAGV